MASIAQMACRMSDEARKIMVALAEGTAIQVHPTMIRRYRTAERTLARWRCIELVGGKPTLTALGQDVLREHVQRFPAAFNNKVKS